MRYEHTRVGVASSSMAFRSRLAGSSAAAALRSSSHCASVTYNERGLPGTASSDRGIGMLPRGPNRMRAGRRRKGGHMAAFPDVRSRPNGFASVRSPSSLSEIRAGVATISSGASQAVAVPAGAGRSCPATARPVARVPAGGLATATNDVARPEELVDLARLSGRFDDYEVSHRTPASVTDRAARKRRRDLPGSRSGTAAAKRRKRGHALTRASAMCSPLFRFSTWRSNTMDCFHGRNPVDGQEKLKVNICSVSIY